MQKSQDDILAEEQEYQEQRNAELQTKIMTTVKQISSMKRNAMYIEMIKSKAENPELATVLESAIIVGIEMGVSEFAEYLE